MANEKTSLTYQWSFLKIYVKDCIDQGFRFLLQIYYQLYHQILLLYKPFILESATYYILDLLFFIMQQIATSEKDLF